MKRTKKKNSYIQKYTKTCGRCGYSGFTKKDTFTCKYCGWPYGEALEGYDVVITRGSLEE